MVEKTRKTPKELYPINLYGFYIFLSLSLGLNLANLSEKST
tara:strand:+ start:107 stop:229 length:123 start_codon:yes stop_codon:yes gene_type:complete